MFGAVLQHSREAVDDTVRERVQKSRTALPAPGKGGLMEDRLSQATQGADGGGSEPRRNPATPSPAPETDVLGILEDIESQFDRLRTIRGDQVAALRELAERSARLEEKKVEIDDIQARLHESQQAWERTRDQQQQALSETQQCLEADRDSHLRRVEQDKATLARDRATLDEDRDRLQRESDAQRATLGDLRAELDGFSTALDVRSEELGETARDLSKQETELNQKIVELQAREEAWLDALAAARRSVSKRGAFILRQRTQLHRFRTVRESQTRRRRGLESAGRRYRRTIEALEARVHTQESRLEEAGRRLRSFMEQLREQADLVERGNAALALVDQLEGRIEELEASQATAPASTETTDRIRELESELESTRSQLSNMENAMDDEHAEDRTRRLAEIARHLHTRRTRLRHLRKAMQTSRNHGQDKPTAEMVTNRLRQSELIEQRQRELDDVRRILANSETKMIKRWAAPRSIVLTSWALLLMMIIAAASWLSAEQIRPAIRTASVAIAPNNPGGDPLSTEDNETWAAFHQSQLAQEGFIRDVARRSAGRKLSPWDSHESVKRLIQNNITLDTGEPGRLVLTLAANDPDRAASFLDILATSMALDSQRSIASRPNGHVSKVLDDRTDGGAVRYARVDTVPIRDDRLVTAGILFAGGLVLSFMIMGVVYARLIRAKRIFEQDHTESLPPPTQQVRPI